MVWQISKWILRLVLGTFIVMGMASCTMLGLNYASLETDNKAIPSPVLEIGFDRDAARATLEAELYGDWPENLPYRLSNRRVVDPSYLGGRGTLEEVTIDVGQGEGIQNYTVVLALPNEAKTNPVPLVISQTFADNCSVFPESPVTAPDGSICDGSQMTGAIGFIATQIFGTYIAYAPVERYFDAGLGYASFYGSDFVPDQNRTAQAVMTRMSSSSQPGGTLINWAYGFSAAADLLAEDTRINANALVAAGHSRFGKSALIAAAWSDHIKGAIAHQSGFAGGSSSRSDTGETLVRMASSYPHWLRPDLAADLKAGTELTLDQHFLLALAAPKPLFLGNARRDVWSDPNSSFRIAQAASKVFEAMGTTGLGAESMRDFRPGDELSFWLRVGGHSVISEDIDAFIAFMQAHFG